MMSGGLTVSVAGIAELSVQTGDELIRKMRKIVQDIENLYRPARVMMPPDKVGVDPVLLALYGGRDSLIEAENCILRIGLEPVTEDLTASVQSVDLDFHDVFGYRKP